MWGPKGVKGRGMTGESWGLKGEGERCFNRSSTFTSFFSSLLQIHFLTFIKRRNRILHTFIPKACYCVSYFLIIVFVFTYILGRIHADDNNFQIHFWYNCILLYNVSCGWRESPNPFQAVLLRRIRPETPFFGWSRRRKNGRLRFLLQISRSWNLDNIYTYMTISSKLGER